MASVGSLCAGIGGLDLGLAAHGHRTEWVCEYDEWPSRVLDERFGVPNYQDITSLDWTTVPRVDILTAGYPCQPFSFAGQRKGTTDERHLWPYVADAVGVLRPRFVFLENVRGHLSMGFGDVLGDLARLGYDAEWGVFQAADIGAPHRRDRIFVVAADATGEGLQGADRPGVEPQWVARRHEETAADADGDAQRPGAPVRRDQVHTDGGSDATRRGSSRGERQGAKPRPHFGAYEAVVARWERVTGTESPDPLDDSVATFRLNPQFVEWMMGFPAGWVTDIAPQRASLKALGNAVVPGVAQMAWSELAGRYLTETAGSKLLTGSA